MTGIDTSDDTVLIQSGAVSMYKFSCGSNEK
jgi:hypothetical protein